MLWEGAAVDLEDHSLDQLASQSFPEKFSVFQSHIAAGGAVLGNGNGAGIEDVDPVLYVPGWHVGMTVQKHVALPQGRKVVFVEFMAVGNENASFTEGKNRVIRHHGKFQHHLIHLGIAIPPHTKDAVAHFVQKGDNSLRGIGFGQVVARAVIKQIAQKQKAVGLFSLEGL